MPIDVDSDEGRKYVRRTYISKEQYITIKNCFREMLQEDLEGSVANTVTTVIQEEQKPFFREMAKF